MPHQYSDVQSIFRGCVRLKLHVSLNQDIIWSRLYKVT
uniref:Uncharacterized protein n=1 Tax=Anguilla anguilla TaxID=7936 RepID=A0A0E9TDN7_ANGAN